VEGALARQRRSALWRSTNRAADLRPQQKRLGQRIPLACTALRQKDASMIANYEIIPAQFFLAVLP